MRAPAFLADGCMSDVLSGEEINRRVYISFVMLILKYCCQKAQAPGNVVFCHVLCFIISRFLTLRGPSISHHLSIFTLGWHDRICVILFNTSWAFGLVLWSIQQSVNTSLMIPQSLEKNKEGCIRGNIFITRKMVVAGT